LGSFQICFGNNPLSLNSTYPVGQKFLTTNYYIVQYQAYTQAGLIFNLGAGPTYASYTISVSQKVNIDQVLLGSVDGSKVLDVAKVPHNYHNSFNLNINSCTSNTCSQYDGNCQVCASQTNCGYCLESGRCYMGNPTGPYLGVGLCNNWRFTYDSSISRVVTVDYSGMDLVDPDYEVYLSSTTPDDLSVSLFVPTGNQNRQWDVVMYLQTSGTYSVYSSSLKNNLVSTISSSQITSMNINLGIGLYDQNSKSLTQPLTTVGATNYYVFARALESIDASSSLLQGGQLQALLSICGSANPGWRNFAKRLAVLTVYDIPSATELTYLAQTRAAILKANVLPVFLVIGDTDGVVSNWYRNLPSIVNGFPSVVLTLDASGNTLPAVFKSIFIYGASLPWVALDNSVDDLVHLDETTLNQNPDLLYITGLTNSYTRAQFILPMKRGDNKTHTALIQIPGFGSATIMDVSNGIPSGSSQTINGKEDDTCVSVQLDSKIFKNLVKPIFNIVTLPTVGSLSVYKSSIAGGSGAAATTGLTTVSSFCFTPLPHDYSWPLNSVYDSFTYYVTDGCANSDTYTISFVIIPVLRPPVSQNYNYTIYEGTNNYNFTITAYDYNRDLSSHFLENVTFTYTYVGAFINPNLFSNTDTTQIFRDPTSNISINFNNTYGPFQTTNYAISQNLMYVYPCSDFFGEVQISFTVSDATGQTSIPYTITITIIPINNVPMVLVNDYYAMNENGQTPSSLTVYATGNDVDNFGVTVHYQLVSLMNSTGVNASVVVDGITGLPMTIGQIYTQHSDPSVHVLTIPLTLTPQYLAYNCPQGTTNFQTGCNNNYAVIWYQTDDNNNLYITSSTNSTVAPALSNWAQVTIQVVHVDQRPNRPNDVSIAIDENTFNNLLILNASDIQLVSGQNLTVLINSLPATGGIHLYNYVSGSIGTEITTSSLSTPLNSFSKKRQAAAVETALFWTPNKNARSTSRNTSWFYDSFTYYAYDGQLASEMATISIFIKPINQPPVPFPTTVSTNENTNVTVLFAASDVDNPEPELNYTITSLPFANGTEGVHIWYVNGSNYWYQLSSSDIPFLVPRLTGVASIVVTNVHDWYGNTSLTYTVKDVDDYLYPTEAGYRVNTVPATLNIIIIPVNQPPVVLPTSPIGFEDTPIIVNLAGGADAWGEIDTTVAVLESDLYDGNGGNASLLGNLYQYTDALYNQLVADISNTAGAISIGNQSVVSDIQQRIIFVPFQHKSTNSPTSFLKMSPWLDYRIQETWSLYAPHNLSSPVGSIKIVVQFVNQVPSAWNTPFNIITYWDSTYDIYNGVWDNPSNNLTGPTSVCYDTCFFFEDFGLRYPNPSSPRQIYFGGQDVEQFDLNIQIVNVTCPDVVQLLYTVNTTEFTITAAQLSNWTYPRTISPGSLQPILSFRPFLDDFNVDNPNENHNQPTAGGHKGDYYCTIEYNVIDNYGAISSSKVIYITVMQINDLPRENVFRPNSDSNSNVQVDFNNMLVDQIIGFENLGTVFYLNAYDVEGDDFSVKIFNCDPTKGSFYGPSANQFTFIDSNGNLQIPSSNPVSQLFSPYPIDCNASQSSFVQLNETFSQTGGKGWYMLFVPNQLDSGSNYNKLSLIYDDGIAPVNTLYGTFRYMNILPVNNAPIIYSNSPSSGSQIEVSYDDYSVLILNPLTFNGTIHVDGSESYTSIVNNPFNWGLQVNDVDAFGATNIDYSITISTRPSKDAAAAYEPGYFSGFPSNATNANVQRDTITFSGTIAQANSYFSTLSFVGDKQGQYTIVVKVNDNGNTGIYCPPGPTFNISGKSCPRTSVATFYISTATLSLFFGNEPEVSLNRAS
jgi:hypothetical protein